MSVIDARGLTKTFGSGASAVAAVTGANISVDAGEIVLLLGPSGSGQDHPRLDAGWPPDTDHRHRGDRGRGLPAPTVGMPPDYACAPSASSFRVSISLRRSPQWRTSLSRCVCSGWAEPRLDRNSEHATQFCRIGRAGATRTPLPSAAARGNGRALPARSWSGHVFRLQTSRPRAWTLRARPTIRLARMALAYFHMYMEPTGRFELPANGLRNHCSTTELRRRVSRGCRASAARHTPVAPESPDPRTPATPWQWYPGEPARPCRPAVKRAADDLAIRTPRECHR